MFKQILVIDNLSISSETAFSWMWQDLIDGEYT